MSTHNIGFYEEKAKLSLSYHQISSSMHLISSAVSIFQELLLMEQTKTLAANIYEAFSQTDDIDEIDVQFQP